MYCKCFSRLLIQQPTVCLIVAKCIVNKKFFTFVIIFIMFNSSKVYCKYGKYIVGNITYYSLIVAKCIVNILKGFKIEKGYLV